MHNTAPSDGASSISVAGTTASAYTNVHGIRNRHGITGIPVVIVVVMSPSGRIIRAIKRIVPKRIISPWIVIAVSVPRIGGIIPIGFVPPGIQISRRITAMYINIVIIMMVNHLRLFITIIVLIPVFLIVIIASLFGVILIIINIGLYTLATYLCIAAC